MHTDHQQHPPSSRHSKTASFQTDIISLAHDTYRTNHIDFSTSTKSDIISSHNNHTLSSLAPLPSLLSPPTLTNTSMATPKQVPYPQERSHHKRFSQRYSSSSSYTEYSSALAASYQHLQKQYHQQQQQQQQQHQQLQYQLHPQHSLQHQQQHTESSSFDPKDGIHLQEPFGTHSKKQSASSPLRRSPSPPYLSSLDSSCCLSRSHSALPSPSLSVSSTDSVSSASMAHCSPILHNISLLQDPLDSMTSSAASSATSSPLLSCSETNSTMCPIVPSLFCSPSSSPSPSPSPVPTSRATRARRTSSMASSSSSHGSHLSQTSTSDSHSHSHPHSSSPYSAKLRRRSGARSPLARSLCSAQQLQLEQATSSTSLSSTSPQAIAQSSSLYIRFLLLPLIPLLLLALGGQVSSSFETPSKYTV